MPEVRSSKPQDQLKTVIKEEVKVTFSITNSNTKPGSPSQVNASASGHYSPLDVRPITPSKMIDKDRKVLVQLTNVDVTFGYGKSGFKAVNDMSLCIYKGEVLGLVGESGSGKSTTGNAILGLVKRTAGTITVGEITIPANPQKITGKLNRQIAAKSQMIFQDPANSLNPYKNIYKVIAEILSNVDVLPVFTKTFDTKTVHTLYKLVHGQPSQPVAIRDFALTTLNHHIEKGDTSSLRTELYVKLIKELASVNLPWAKSAKTYLEVRLYERDQFFVPGKKPDIKRIKRKLVIDMLKAVGLSERILNRYPLEFSGGQQQRIGISRALLIRPELLVADEPISALDVSIQAQVINILNDLKEALGLTILFIAHDLRMVEYVSDRIAVMYKGQLVEIGPAHEVSHWPVHPYTKMLLDAVPSIDAKQGSLVGFTYDPTMHHYSKLQGPNWHEVAPNHYVFGTIDEIKRWVQGDYRKPSHTGGMNG